MQHANTVQNEEYYNQKPQDLAADLNLDSPSKKQLVANKILENLEKKHVDQIDKYKNLIQQYESLIKQKDDEYNKKYQILSQVLQERTNELNKESKQQLPPPATLRQR